MLGMLRRNKWRILGAGAVAGAGYAIYRAVKSLPVKEIIAIAAAMKDRIPEEVDVTLNSGDAARLFAACLRDLRTHMAARVDVQEKQALAKAVDRNAVQERLLAFKELSVASLTRTVTAVYMVCMAQLLIYTQIIELVRLQKSGRDMPEEAQRRFLSLVQKLSSAEGESPLGEVVERVEAAVRNFLDRSSQSQSCDAPRIQAIFEEIREHVEGPRHDTGTRDGTAVRHQQGWVAELMRQLVVDAMEECENLAQPSVEGPNPHFMGIRLEKEIRWHSKAMLTDVKEVIESELFSEAVASTLDVAFELLVATVVDKTFANASRPSLQPESSEPRATPTSGDGSEVKLDRTKATDADVPEASPPSEIASAPVVKPVPLLKIVPVVSNLFVSITHPDTSSTGITFGTIVSRQAECKGLFEALYTLHGGSEGLL